MIGMAAGFILGLVAAAFTETAWNGYMVILLMVVLGALVEAAFFGNAFDYDGE